MRTANPAMRVFDKPQTWDDLTGAAAPAARTEALPRAMTFGGTIMASFILTGICGAVAVAVYAALQGPSPALPLYPALIGSVLAGLVLALVIAMAPRTAPFLSPLYAAAEGVVVGAISVAVPAMFGVGEGVVFQAMLLTFGILFGLLAAYRAGLVRIGSTAAKVIVVATAGVAVYYLAVIVMNLLGFGVVSLGWQGGWMGIGFSLFVVALASLNLVLDFQYIEAGVAARSPKHMEWYAAFGLLVTLVWLYIEVLRLLAKIQSRD